MSWIQLFVTLKVTDNVGLTALQTIQTRLHHADVSSVHRSEFWEWQFDGLSAEAAQARVEQLVSKTALFANPTKHRWVIQASEHSFAEQTSYTSPFGGHASILVCDREDGTAEATFEALSRFLVTDELPQSLQRGTWWDIHCDETSAPQAEAIANELAVTSSRTNGIFCNPHYQDHHIVLPHG